MSLHTPVVFVVFRRPELTARVMERIREARPERLWVIADGARANRPNEARQVAAVRRLIDERIDWPCDVRRVYADHNLGCAQRVSSGLDAVFAVEEEAIILEDDCLPDPTFFRFCTELLAYYRNEPRIAVIAGDNFQRGAHVTADSYYFSRYPHCWGWATWRRAWRLYDHAMTAWPTFGSTPEFRESLSSAAEERYWRHAFDRTKNGDIDTWDNRWTLACWCHQRLTILPAVNLVSNIGFGLQATHTKSNHPAANLPAKAMTFPLRHPITIQGHAEADASTAQLLFRRSGPLKRALSKLHRIATSFQ